MHQAGATTSEVKVPEAVVTTVEEGATGGVSSVTGRITGAEVVAEVAQHVELMSVTRGLTMLDMLVVVVAAQQLLVHLQNEGQHIVVARLLRVSFGGPQIVLKLA